MDFIQIKNRVQVKKTKCKNPHIIIKQTGDIFINVPYFYCREDSLKLLDKYKDWVEKNLAKINKARLEIENFSFMHSNEILIFGEWKNMDSSINITSLKAKLLDYLLIKVPILATLMNLSYNKISVKMSKTRLGSCSYQNNLNFSFLLIFASKSLIDYVIIHELSHILHKNHSKDFWNFVEKFCPNYKEKRKELHENIRFYLVLLDKL
ncbi:SprT family zinc-dependent metalloprotease [Helicobacter sp. 13S00477-4]|uniref:M48 family metallopeptidase n=1 Tax=Helicobacter sp. 13S00477-4 TaxID=1905759 RepID=UPI000BA58CF7|nr:SprT family zinc-dependent metalloprotease [Helicobacter sp. 13S00477-4]PAF52662.1 hypothetical protein BKH44_00290 [Helicobacter sp. 13S00477-4]